MSSRPTWTSVRPCVKSKTKNKQKAKICEISFIKKLVVWLLMLMQSFRTPSVGTREFHLFTPSQRVLFSLFHVSWSSHRLMILIWISWCLMSNPFSYDYRHICIYFYEMYFQIFFTVCTSLDILLFLSSVNFCVYFEFQRIVKLNFIIIFLICHNPSGIFFLSVFIYLERGSCFISLTDPELNVM